MRGLRGMLAALLVGVAGCGGGGGGGGSTVQNIGGIWFGSINAATPGVLEIETLQNGGNLTGTARATLSTGSNPSAFTGNCTGTLSGDHVALVADLGAFGQVTVDGTLVNGVVTGSYRRLVIPSLDEHGTILLQHPNGTSFFAGGNYTGTVQVTSANPAVAGNLAVNVAQSFDNLTATVSLTGTAATFTGTATGAIIGSHVTFSGLDATNHTFSLDGVLSGNTLAGNWAIYGGATTITGTYSVARP